MPPAIYQQLVKNIKLYPKKDFKNIQYDYGQSLQSQVECRLLILKNMFWLLLLYSEEIQKKKLPGHSVILKLDKALWTSTVVPTPCPTPGDEDPVLAKKTDPGLCTSNEGIFLKVYFINILDNF